MLQEEKAKTAAIIIIGDEILSGRTEDKNTGWIAGRLAAHGVDLREVRVIPDVAEMIIETVNALRPLYDYILTTGGIGPTHDDITAECIARAFDVPLVKNETIYAAMEEAHGVEGMNAGRAKMTMIPAGADLIPNPVSTAPGFMIGNVHAMAGIPHIMHGMMDHLLDHVILPGRPMCSRTVACALPESMVAEDLGKLQKTCPDVQIGSYPHYLEDGPGLHIVMRGTNKPLVTRAEKAVEDIVVKHGGEIFKGDH